LIKRQQLFRILAVLSLLLITAVINAQAPAIPKVSINVGPGQEGDLSLSLQIILLLTVLSLAPAIVILLTSFTRIVIVLSFTRNALGTQQIPPNSVLIGLALFLTAFTMAPVWQQIDKDAYQPYMQKQIGYKTAFELAKFPLRSFMFKQTRDADLRLFIELAKVQQPKTMAEVPTYILIPAFIISELKTAFTMGFLIFIPFVIVDLVVATVLMSMGMMMMPPVLISLPCKIMLFVMIDGWALIARSLVTSFN